MLRNFIKRPIVLIFIFLISANLSIILDLPILRQLLGFLFLAFVPGLLLLCIINLYELSLLEKFILSIGLSISFVMITGLIINSLYPLFGYETPLSMNSLVPSLTSAILILAVIIHTRNGYRIFPRLAYPKLENKDKIFLLTPIFFPLLSVFGVHLMNSNGNNSIIIILLLAIPAYVIIIALYNKHVTEKAYPPIIFLISISLVLLMGMRSNHIIGTDAHIEYYIFRQTLSNEMWTLLSKSTLDSCLSISIFPTIYQSFLNVNTEYLFKVLYPMLFSISPLITYKISSNYISNPHAFLASMLFMSQQVFLGAAANPRTAVAILFFALSIMVLFNDQLPESKKRLLVIIFIISCVFSHYSTTYVFFIMLVLTYIVIRIIDRLQYDSPRRIPKPSVPLGLLMFFFIFIFFWYNQVTQTVFDRGVLFFIESIKSFSDLFIIESRSENVALALGRGTDQLEAPQKIYFIFSWLVIILISFGVLSTLVKYRLTLDYHYNSYQNANDASWVLTRKIDHMFFYLALICYALMVTSVAVPFVSKGYGMDRLYLQILVVLSPFFVIGGVNLAQFIHIRKRFLIVLIVLVPLFMCTTATIHQLYGLPTSIVLNSEGENFDIYFIYDQETFAAKWLNENFNYNLIVFSDFFGNYRLISQGLIRYQVSKYMIMDIMKEETAISDGYIYIRHCGIVDGMLLDKHLNWHNLADYQYKIAENNLIYSNRGSEIWLIKNQ